MKVRMAESQANGRRPKKGLHTAARSRQIQVRSSLLTGNLICSAAEHIDLSFRIVLKRCRSSRRLLDPSGEAKRSRKKSVKAKSKGLRRNEPERNQAKQSRKDSGEAMSKESGETKPKEIRRSDAERKCVLMSFMFDIINYIEIRDLDNRTEFQRMIDRIMAVIC